MTAPGPMRDTLMNALIASTDWQAREAGGACWRLTADDILRDFVVIPRSEIQGVEYGWRRSDGDVEINSPDLGELRTYIRNLVVDDDGQYFEHLTRRIPRPETAIPITEEDV